MDKTVLVTPAPDIEGGKTLLKELDEAELDVRAALWHYLPEPQEWRLIVAFPSVDKVGPRESYRLVQSALEKIKGKGNDLKLSLKDISVVSPNDSLIKLFGKIFRTSPKAMGEHWFINSAINNISIEAALVYRMTKDVS